MAYWHEVYTQNWPLPSLIADGHVAETHKNVCVGGIQCHFFAL